MMRQLCKHAIILRFDFDEYIQSIMVSPSEMTQVIINLLSNSALAIREQFKTQGGKRAILLSAQKPPTPVCSYLLLTMVLEFRMK